MKNMNRHFSKEDTQMTNKVNTRKNAQHNQSQGNANQNHNEIQLHTH